LYSLGGQFQGSGFPFFKRIDKHAIQLETINWKL